MKYADLHDLLIHSSSTRRYFLSQPVKMQLALYNRGNYIHTAHELRMHIDAVNAYNRAVSISGAAETDI